jgi:alpha-amylase
LFEWQWNDIAAECENVLGPKGFSAVQVSPPQKSVSGNQWWTRYQPVSYAIEGRSGNRSEFADMVTRCNAVGVDIYVDAVINHMAAFDRSFPEVPYGPNDFHNCTSEIDYSNVWSIQNCDLVGLNDLNTGSSYVQQKIADYLNDLTGLGVAGFRIDAAKHMSVNDINGIKNRLTGNPYIFQEVIGAGGEPVQPGDYTGIGDVTEFNFSNTLGHHFKLRSPLKEISNIGNWPGWLASDKAITFVSNHDNQRQNTNNIVTHKDGNNANNMAHVFMLAWPYGYPKVMSSYDWSDHDQGPPSHGASSCNGGWLCEHRNRAILNMVGFRNATSANNAVTDYWDNGANQMAWGRAGLGFVVINMEGQNLNRTFQTGMVAGTYCDVINGDFDGTSCTGPTINVDQNGNANLNVFFRNGVAIHVDARLGAPCTDCGNDINITFTCEQGNTENGQSVYVAGDHSSLGNWNLANAFKLSSNEYPNWTGSIDLPENTEVEWKCVKRDDDNASTGVEWQSGDNNSFNTSSNANPSASFGGGGMSSPVVTFSCANGYTNPGQSVYVVGDLTQLGGWDPASAVIMNPDSYPTWSSEIEIPADTNVEWKCLKRDENNPNSNVQWQSGGNNSFNSGATNSSSNGSF